MLPENFPIYYMKFGSLAVTSEHAADVMQQMSCSRCHAADVMQESKCMILHLTSQARLYTCRKEHKQVYNKGMPLYYAQAAEYATIVLCTSDRVCYLGSVVYIVCHQQMWNLMIQIISLVKRVMACVHVEHGFTCGWHDCSSGWWQRAWLLCVVVKNEMNGDQERECRNVFQC